MIKIYCDGSWRESMPGKPGFAAFIAWQNDCEVKRWKGRVKVSDSFQAEFLAIFSALEWASLQNMRKIQIVTDNQIAVQILIGRVHSEKYQKLCERILIMKYQYFDEVVFSWVPREQNELADSLCSEAAEKQKNSFGKVGSPVGP